jgi:hypothetical protein
LEAELGMANDLIDNLRIFDEGDDTPLASAVRAEEHREAACPSGQPGLEWPGIPNSRRDGEIREKAGR